ncbi:MAG: type II CRISPR RNA-guided endonuclease Cas9 [Bacteroidales bacterium]|nr:type II CRISPR RNA-guided endonuclease Cas9 [Bacteroidales bacterium]
MAKKILGLDLGANSIGWALIEETENNSKIIAMGSRIIPLNPDDKDEFMQGNAISKNQKRTEKRTQRKGYDRYQLRRKALTEVLLKNNMFDPNLFNLKQLELWGLRAKAVNEKISLTELGRILYHLNQKRGYKSPTKASSLEKKETEYVQEVKNRYQLIKEQNLTIGQKFYEELKQNPYYRTKEQVFPREAYIEEFDKIIECQKKYYPHVLTEELVNKIKNEIIYYQRPLKSQKGLVCVCEFEGRRIIINGKEIFVGPKVAPKSSPIFQITKIWETINNLKLKNKNGEQINIPIDKKRAIFEYLDKNEKLTTNELFKILEIKKEDGWYGNKQINNGIQGNITKVKILKALEGQEFDAHILQFNIEINEFHEEVSLVDTKTGEYITTNKKVVLHNIEQEPFYQLWHTIYSIDGTQECKQALIKKFNLSEQLAEKLANIDFKTSGYGNKSVKAMRKILPYLMDGYNYSNACSLAGYNHSFSLTKEELLQNQLKDKLELLPKNSLRQPIVEKILNQLINLVNEIIDENRGWVTRQDRISNNFEIRVELARELTSSKEERNEAFKLQREREKQNKIIAERLEKEYGLKPTRNNIIKWRLFHEITNEQEARINAICIYCGQPFGFSDALTGNNIDIEHIIPKSLLFDDSQNNKTLSHRHCNAAKGQNTAYDYMKSLGDDKFNEYIERVDKLFKDKLITKSKRDKLLMPASKIPKDFISRQLRESQYIARKAKQILGAICYNVCSTSGSITEHLRRIWGWDDVLMELQLPKYRAVGLTEIIEIEIDGQIHQKEVIKGWTKRDDQRHHAIDALVIACTQQGFVQRINTLASQTTKTEMLAELENQTETYKKKLSLLDKYLISKRPFTTQQVKEKVANILVSYKAGKKVATYSVRKINQNGKKVIVQQKIITPRGPLSEESIYGKIKIIEKDKDVKYLFENYELIINQHVKQLVLERLQFYQFNSKKALASLKNAPIYLDPDKKVKLEKAHCYKEEYVIKYPLQTIKPKDANSIVDKKIRELVTQRLEQYKDKEKEAFKDPLYLDDKKTIPIKTVRCFTGLTKVEPIKKDENGNDIGFVKPGNNHHIAIYTDQNGNKYEHVCTFWHAVERKKYGIPIIIYDTQEVWNKILNQNHSFPQSFIEKLPNDQWTLLFSMQLNEMFLLGLKNEDIKQCIDTQNYSKLSEHLYRVQKIAQKNYMFRHHLETQINDSAEAKLSKRFYLIQSINALYDLNPIKVKIDLLGQIYFLDNI